MRGGTPILVQYHTNTTITAAFFILIETNQMLHPIERDAVHKKTRTKQLQRWEIKRSTSLPLFSSKVMSWFNTFQRWLWYLYLCCMRSLLCALYTMSAILFVIFIRRAHRTAISLMSKGFEYLTFNMFKPTLALTACCFTHTHSHIRIPNNRINI